MEKSLFSPDAVVFLQLLRQTRERRGISQVELAARLDATQSFISKCERGERRLDILELRTWCKALGTSLTAFARQLDTKLK